jgi:hypothetical protein
MSFVRRARDLGHRSDIHNAGLEAIGASELWTPVNREFDAALGGYAASEASGCATSESARTATSIRLAI